MIHLQLDNSKKFDIVAIGRVAVDLNPVDYYKPLDQSTTFKRYLGGSPANIVTGLARLGKKPGFIGKVSDDQLGTFVTDTFQAEGVDTSQLVRAENGEKIGLTFTEILSETESSIVMYRNCIADLALRPEEVSEEYIQNSKLFLVSGTALAESPSREAVLKGLLYARKHHVPIVFDIDYRPYNWTSKEETAIYYSLIAEHSDIIMGSKEEFALTEALIGTDRTDEQTAEHWLNRQGKLIIIKHGSQGSIAYTKEKSYVVKPFPVELLKSFGGGDGYASAFLYGLLEGYPLAKCLELATASAAMLVASHACSEDMPTVAELEKFIADSHVKPEDVVYEKK